MAHGDAREGKWRGKMRMEWVASSLAMYVGTRSIQLPSADPHSSNASSWLNWNPRRFKWTRPFRWKTKSGFCACVITFRTCYTTERVSLMKHCFFFKVWTNKFVLQDSDDSRKLAAADLKECFSKYFSLTPLSLYKTCARTARYCKY